MVSGRGQRPRGWCVCRGVIKRSRCGYAAAKDKGHKNMQFRSLEVCVQHTYLLAGFDDGPAKQSMRNAL
jgi:hypothetical protein